MCSVFQATQQRRCSWGLQIRCHINTDSTSGWEVYPTGESLERSPSLLLLFRQDIVIDIIVIIFVFQVIIVRWGAASKRLSAFLVVLTLWCHGCGRCCSAAENIHTCVIEASLGFYQPITGSLMSSQSPQSLLCLVLVHLQSTVFSVWNHLPPPLNMWCSNR